MARTHTVAEERFHLTRAALLERLAYSGVVANVIRSIRNLTPSLEDADLVLAARGDEPWARDALFRRHLDAVRTLIFRLMGPHGGQREVLERAFVDGFSSLAELKDPAAFVAWMFRVSARTARGELIRERRRRWLLRRRRPDLQAFRSKLVLLGNHEQRADVAAVYDGIEPLSVNARLALLLRQLEGFEPAEIAQTLQVSVARVRRQLASAEQHCRALGAHASPSAALRRSELTPVPLSEFERTHLGRRIETALRERSRPRVGRWTIAGALLLVLVVGIAATGVGIRQPIAASSVERTFAERQRLEFPDGSRIALSSGSELKLETLASESVRVVLLAGQGEFDLAANAPVFEIVAGGALVIASGHRLAVSVERPNATSDGSVHVHAIEGSATVHREGEASLTLGSGETWSARFAAP